MVAPTYDQGEVMIKNTMTMALIAAVILLVIESIMAFVMLVDLRPEAGTHFLAAVGAYAICNWIDS